VSSSIDEKQVEDNLACVARIWF